MTDVLIAGGGPAGAIAALLLARAGVRVAVIDRARFPRDKLCGDSLNPGALRLLQRLGVGSAADAGLPIDGMVVTGEGGVRVDARYGDGVIGRALTRRVLDAALLEAAAAAGAEIHEAATVRGPVVETREDERRVVGLELAEASGRARQVRARLVIAADGRHSRIARALGLAAYPARPRRWAVGAYFEHVGELTGCGEMHVRSGHYIGVAPVPDGRVNVCLVTGNGPSLRHPADLLRERLSADAQLAHRFAGARMIATPVVMGPLAVECRAPGAPGLLLAGDAAGFIDPMTGDGLRLAMRGAELAAAEALRDLEQGTFTAHVRLRAERRRAFAHKWRFNRALRWMVDVPLALRTAARGAAFAPGWLQHAVRYAGDLQAA
jgi:geranylgeranyl reductase family protein